MKKEYNVTAKGSLGLLALGHVGVREWREAIKKANAEVQNISEKQNVKKTKK